MPDRTEHHCHALNCGKSVPPRMHMCSQHWRMVPRGLQADLWANYQRGQEDTMDPTPDYLRAAAACVRAVAEKEKQPPDEIEAEVQLYLRWAQRIESAA